MMGMGQVLSYPARASWLRAARGVLVAVLAAVAGCDDGGPVPPEALRFGQVGSIQARLEVPLGLGVGELTQTLTWRSTGSWTLSEAISYDGVLGDAQRVDSIAEVVRAGQYALLITQVNESEGLRLLGLGDELPEDLDPTCGPTRTRITIQIVDDARLAEKSWVRCVDGSLTSLTPAGAGPGAAASRLAQVALLMARSTVGADFRSSYSGSVPFATLERGADTPSNVRTSMAVTDSVEWSDFWRDHAPGRALPAVDFTENMVVVGITGVRNEAGDSVEVRRVLPVDIGTLIHVVDRVLGNFCSPAARRHVPFHIVVAPRTPTPHNFASVGREEVPCG